jgi:hypothetical protein
MPQDVDIVMDDFIELLDGLSEDSGDEPMSSPSVLQTPASSVTSTGSLYSAGSGMQRPVNGGTDGSDHVIANPQIGAWNRERLRTRRESSSFDDIRSPDGLVLQSIEDVVWDGPHTPRSPSFPIGDAASPESQDGAKKEYEVLRIIGEKIGQLIHEFLIEWFAYEEQSWIPVKDCSCPDRIREFREQQLRELLAAGREHHEEAIRKLQRLSDAGEAHELDTFKVPKIPGWRICRRSLNGRFQGPGFGDSVLEVVRLPSVPPRDARANTARLRGRSPSAYPDHRGLDHEDDIGVDEVVWIRTDVILGPQVWPGEFQVKEESVDPNTVPEDNTVIAFQSEERERVEMERIEIERRRADDVEETRRKEEAEAEESELLRVFAEYERRKRELNDMEKKKAEMEAGLEKKKADMEAARLKRKKRERLERETARRAAQKRELEAQCFRQCTNILQGGAAVIETPKPGSQRCFDIQQPVAVDEPAGQHRTIQGTIPNNARDASHPQDRQDAVNPPSNFRQPIAEGSSCQESAALPCATSILPRHAPKHRNEPIAGPSHPQQPVVNQSGGRRNTALRPATPSAENSRRKRSASSLHRSGNRRQLKAHVEARRQGAAQPNPLRNQFRRDMDPRHVQSLFNQARLPPAPLPLRQFYN